MKIILGNISKSYGEKKVIDNLSFTFKSGKPVVIEGESGIGKTTLLRLITGLETPDSGSITFDGIAREKCRFAPVFQETRLIESLDAVTNIKLIDRSLPEEKIISALTSLIPADEIRKKAGELSGGTARRVEIVRAILSPSDVLIMDEPLTGLDEENAVKVVSYIQDNVGDRLFITSSHSKLFGKWCSSFDLSLLRND